MQQFYIRRLREDVPLLKQLLVELDTSHYEAEPNFYRPPKELAQLRESYGTFEKYFDGSVSAFIACSQRKVVGFISGSVRNVQSLISPEKRVGFINELIVSE
ncbi:GNAT family N-acetyltransferase, partial [Vibrio diabolicus]